jgi:hypothetical protein
MIHNHDILNRYFHEKYWKIPANEFERIKSRTGDISSKLKKKIMKVNSFYKDQTICQSLIIMAGTGLDSYGKDY